MSSEQNDAIPIDPQLYSESIQANPPSSFLTSSFNTTSSIFGSSSPPSTTEFRAVSSTSSIFGSTVPTSLSASESSGSDQMQLLLARVQALETKIQAMESEMAKQKALLERVLKKRGWDADDENDEEQASMLIRKKKKLSETRPLTSLPLNELTEEQAKTRKELLTHIDREMRTLAGLKDTELVLPVGAIPGEENGNIIPDFKKEVGDDINKRLISQAAFLIYTQQTDTELRKLTYPYIPFTARDMDELAKEAFRSWKRRHEISQDPEKKKKHKETSKKTMRRQRKRQKKIDRGKAAEIYAGEANVDASPLLLTDWMSDYVSDRSDIVTQKDKDEYSDTKRRAAGYSPQAKDVEIWETIRPAFRSAEVNEVYAKLDEIFAEKQRLSKKRKPAVKRVFLGKLKYDIPACAPYPFMVDPAWKSVFVDEKGLADEFKMMPRDPKKFGSRRNEGD